MESKKLWEKVEENLFPGHSNMSKGVNNVLKRLYGLNLKPDFDTLESIISGEAISLNKLNQISTDVARAESVSLEFSALGYKGKSALRKVDQITETKKAFGRATGILKGKKSGEQTDIRKKMKNYQSNPDTLALLRQEADSIDNLLFGDEKDVGLYNLTNTQDFAVSKTSLQYHENRKKIPLLKKNLEKIKDRYLNFDKSGDPDKELSKLAAEVKENNKVCEKGEYYEGTFALKQLNEEINLIRKFAKKYILKKKDIQNDTKFLAKQKRNFEKLKQSGVSEEGIKELKKLEENYNPNKYNYAKNMFLNDAIAAYESQASELKDGINDVILNENIRINNEYKDLKKKIDMLDEKVTEIGKYEAVNEKLNNIVSNYENTNKTLNGLVSKLDDLQNRDDSGKFKELNEELYKKIEKLIKKEEKKEEVVYQKNANQKEKIVLFSDELKNLELPLDTRYHVIEDALQGRMSSDGWVSRIELLDTVIDSLTSSGELAKTDYPMKVYEKLSNFYQNGYLGKVATFSPNNKEKIETAINHLYQFAQKVNA
ncbi:MAG: hypothetical protein ABH828_00300 [archaeon]